MENKITPKEIIELIKSLPDSDSHIFENNGEVIVTNEWICGTFAGRGFSGETKEEAAQQLIDYLYRHIGHNSMVGATVTISGFPDLEKVKRYCELQSENLEKLKSE